MVPVSVVAAMGGGAAAVAVVGVVATRSHEDYSDHTRHSEYSDYAERRRREEEARENRRKENLRVARQEMNKTLDNVRNSLAHEAGGEADIFQQWKLNSNSFSYKNFPAEYEKLDETARDKIKTAASNLFDAEERACQQELDDINKILRQIAATRLKGK